MVFSSTLFLFVFLPAVLLLYFLAGRAWRNTVLLLASLVFYTWGETVYVLLMVVSILSNYLFGLAIDHSKRSGDSGKFLLCGAIVLNIGLLGFFKYANFFVNILNLLLHELNISPVHLDPIHLPIGISFFTFQAISYVVDLYRGDSDVQRNPLSLALYISMFPQLIAGPIVRYHDVSRALKDRVTSLDDIFYGTQRFVIGLGKKVLIANQLGESADYIFSLPPSGLFSILAWLGAIAYTLQIYYDFSGYSDMAIGLGRIFGFRFPENFNYPYISRSIREFWQRWHISLSSWFKDYLYIPLGGNKVSRGRVYVNLFIVFILCGLWHGASWTFVLWGVYHGLFIVLERLHGYGESLRKFPVYLQRIYTMLIVLFGWVLFRAESLEHALLYLQAMFDPSRPAFFNSPLFLHLNNEFYLILAIAVAGATPFPKQGVAWLSRFAHSNISSEGQSFLSAGFSVGYVLFFFFVLSYSIASVASGSYNPFLYFRF